MWLYHDALYIPSVWIITPLPSHNPLSKEIMTCHRLMPLILNPIMISLTVLWIGLQVLASLKDISSCSQHWFLPTIPHSGIQCDSPLEHEELQLCYNV